MTILPSLPPVKGFTANNLRGSVWYRRRPPAAARAPDRTQLRGNGLLDGSLSGRLGVRSGSHGGACSSRRTQRLARRLARVSLWRMVRDGPSILPDGSLAALRRRIQFETGPASYPTARSQRFGGWFEAGPASFPTARSWRFGGWFGRDGPGDLPGGTLAALWRMVRGGPGVLPDGSLMVLQRMVQRMPGGVPDGLRISFRLETGPAACPTARSCITSV